MKKIRSFQVSRPEYTLKNFYIIFKTTQYIMQYSSYKSKLFKNPKILAKYLLRYV